MEIIQILRNHIAHVKPPTIPASDTFLTILNNIEKQLTTDLQCQNNELHYDQHIARCIDLEGRILFKKNL
jgi:hypothetical protein